MVNDARLSRNKKPIGFINPLVSVFVFSAMIDTYSMLCDLVFEPKIYSDLFCGAFNDITSGDNPGCGTHGFKAVRGWDPVTGLGTPNLERLVDRWIGLP
jgi:tripeptidyl-peptidase-1